MRSLLLVRLVLRATAFPLQTGCGTNATVLSFTSTSSPSGMVFPSPTAPSAAMVFSKAKGASLGSWWSAFFYPASRTKYR